nr:putative reverse transcriptase domain-containing protein [Tanacetum cinerariifolium]
MSDSEDSTITYTAVSSPFGGWSDIRSRRVDGPLVMPKDSYAYVVVAFQAPPSLDFVSGPEYPPSPEFVPLELPKELSRVHKKFHVSNLKKCHADEPLAVSLDGLHFEDKLHFVEEPIEIMDREFKRLKRSRIPLIKV